MSQPSAEKITTVGPDARAKGPNAAETVVNANIASLTDSEHASVAALKELRAAYLELATRNANNLSVAMKALSAVKSPVEFIELQQKLIKEGVQAAVADSQNIVQLTTAVFTSAFEPVKKQVEALHKAPLH